jgi:hypothetical protein
MPITNSITDYGRFGGFFASNKLKPIMANLIAWGRPSDPSTITEVSNSVSQMDNLANLANPFINNVASTQAEYGLTTLNGKNTLKFGLGDALTTQLPIPHTPASTVFTVTSNIQNITGQNNDLFRDTSNVGRVTFMARSLGGVYCMYNGDLIQSNVSGYNDTALLTSVYAGAASKLRRNGVEIASGQTGGLNRTDTLRLGSSGFNGELAEVLIYDAVLSPEEIAHVEAYLLGEFNL